MSLQSSSELALYFTLSRSFIIEGSWSCVFKHVEYKSCSWSGEVFDELIDGDVTSRDIKVSDSEIFGVILVTVGLVIDGGVSSCNIGVFDTGIFFIIGMIVDSGIGGGDSSRGILVILYRDENEFEGKILDERSSITWPQNLKTVGAGVPQKSASLSSGTASFRLVSSSINWNSLVNKIRHSCSKRTGI